MQKTKKNIREIEIRHTQIRWNIVSIYLYDESRM